MDSCYLRAEKLGIAADGVCPTNRIANNGLNVFVIEYGEGFVAGLEIEDPAVAAVEGATGAEHLAALIPAHENNLVGLGNTERLGIGLNTVKLEISADALSDRVGGVNGPNAL